MKTKTAADQARNTTRIACAVISTPASAMVGRRPALRMRTSGSLGTSQRTESCAPPGNTATQLPAGYGMHVFSGGKGA